MGGRSQEERLGFVSLLEAGDVAQGVDHLNPSVVVDDGKRGGQQRLASAVGRQPPDLSAGRRSAFVRVGEEGAAEPAVERALSFVKPECPCTWTAHRRPPLPAHQALAGRVRLHDQAGAVGDDDAVGDPRHDDLRLPLEATGFGRHGPMVPGDATHHEDQADHGHDKDNQ